MHFCGRVVPGRFLKFDKVLLVVGGLVVIIWLQYAAGKITYSGDVVVSTLYLCGFLMAWWLGSNSAYAEHDLKASLRLFASLLVACAVVSVFIALLQWLRMESMLGIFAADRGPEQRPFANFGQPNHLATFSLMGVVFASLLYVEGHLKRSFDIQQAGKHHPH